MKIKKTASGRKIEMTRSEWLRIGHRAGWFKTAGLFGKMLDFLDKALDVEIPEGAVRCNKCQGARYTMEPDLSGEFIMEVCPKCHGEGFIFQGEGQLNEQTDLQTSSSLTPATKDEMQKDFFVSSIDNALRHIKQSQIIPSDGFADGGVDYTDDEMDFMAEQTNDVVGFIEGWARRNKKAIEELGRFAMRLDDEKKDALKAMLADVVNDYVYSNSRQDYDPSNYQKPPVM